MVKVGIIGSKGQLGSDLARTFCFSEVYKIALFPHESFDVTNRKDYRQLNNVDIVINTAAYHKVDEVENNPAKAFSINAVANKHLAEYCAVRDKTLVFISTDYVFGGDRSRKLPYTEKDKVCPVNTYGISKATGEMFVRSIAPKHYIIRTSGLFGVEGASGKGGNFVETMIKLAKKRKLVSVVNDWLCPTYTKNLAEQIEILIQTNKYGTYHAVSEGGCSWYEFTKEIFKLKNFDVELKSKPHWENYSMVERPEYCVLKNAKLNKLGINNMKHWKDALKDYLIEKGHLDKHGINK